MSNPESSVARGGSVRIILEMIEEHDFHYALENTRVVVQPQRIIETFGSTSFRFLLVSELMDEANVVRIRGGRIEAERPRIVSPHHFSKLLLEGFGGLAREFADWVEQHSSSLRVLRYGFQLRKSDLEQSIVRDSMEAVLGNLKEDLTCRSDPTAALIAGVDEAWEVCLLKFTMDMIQRSSGENLDEWRRRGLI